MKLFRVEKRNKGEGNAVFRLLTLYYREKIKSNTFNLIAEMPYSGFKLLNVETLFCLQSADMRASLVGGRGDGGQEQSHLH